MLDVMYATEMDFRLERDRMLHAAGQESNLAHDFRMAMATTAELPDEEPTGDIHDLRRFVGQVNEAFGGDE